MMEKLNFKLEVFEGPLDLMLHLIQKHKLNINDISISTLLEQYLDYIERMKMADLEVASEFLSMAAHLVYMKTLSLLPRHEEAESLKKELEGQLLEYQLCKEVASRLNQLFQGNDIFVRKPQKIETDKTYLGCHDKEELLRGYCLAMGKAKRNLPPSQTVFSGIVTRRMVSVTSRILFVLKRLYETGESDYQDFFQGGDRSEQVATFLAVLELIKSKRITANEENTKLYFNRTYQASPPEEWGSLTEDSYQ